MLKEIELAIQQFGAGAITYAELLQAVYCSLSANPERSDEILASIAVTSDPLLVELEQDVRRILENKST